MYWEWEGKRTARSPERDKLCVFSLCMLNQWSQLLAQIVPSYHQGFLANVRWSILLWSVPHSVRSMAAVSQWQASGYYFPVYNDWRQTQKWFVYEYSLSQLVWLGINMGRCLSSVVSCLCALYCPIDIHPHTNSHTHTHSWLQLYYLFQTINTLSKKMCVLRTVCYNQMNLVTLSETNLR